MTETTGPPQVGWRSIREVAADLVRAIQANPPDDNQVADVVGELDAAIALLRSMRATLVAEAPGPVVGERYRLTESRKATRSYNTDRLLWDFHTAAGHRSLHDTIRELVVDGALRLNWQWSKLQQAADRWDVTLQVAKHEVASEGDLDEAHVGEVWTSTLTPKPT